MDGLRALAVLPVILFHCDTHGFRWGYVGVDVFFVISGYLITSILVEEYAANGKVSFAAFYRRRALRLLPALAALCLAFLWFSYAVLGKPELGPRVIAPVLLYYGNWVKAFGGGMAYFDHTWSLAIEEQFYTVWPLLVVVTLSFRRPARVVLWLVIALALAAACWRAFLFAGGTPAIRLYNGTDTRADALLIGSALSLALGIPAIAARLAPITRHLWIPAAIILIALPTMLPWPHPYMHLGGFAVVALASAAVLAAALQPGPLAEFLSRPVLVWVGKRSYGLYLWHFPVGTVALLQFRVADAGKMTLIVLAATFALAAQPDPDLEYPFLERRYAPGRAIRQTVSPS